MRDFIRTFKERKGEVEMYFDFLEIFMIQNAQIIYPDGNKEILNKDVSEILRANGFLLIYNVVESSITQGVESIYIDIIDKGYDYNCLKTGIKKSIVSNVKTNIKAIDFVNGVQGIAMDIISHYPQKIFSGNIDAKKIKEVASIYGFSHITDSTKTKDGYRLLTVRLERNALAHGEKSFKECGKDFIIQDMIEIKNEVMVYLEQILDNLEMLISNEEYKI